MKKRGSITSLSNLLSLLRVVLVAPGVWALATEQRALALVIFLVAAATDYLDGLAARSMREVSEIGKVIDPVADKIFIGSVAVTLLLLGEIPWWFLGAILLRDLLILAGGIVVQKRTGVVLPSNWPGKWAAGISALALFLAAAGVSGTALYVVIAAALFLLIWSFILYLNRAIRTLNRSQPV